MKFPNGHNNSKADVALIVYGFHFQSPLVDGRKCMYAQYQKYGDTNCNGREVHREGSWFYYAG